MQTDALILLGTFALLAGRPTSTGLVFEPEEGTTLARRFVYTSEIALDGLSIEVDGEDMSGVIGDIGFEVESTQTLVVDDEFVSVEDGVIRELRRKFKELGGVSTVQIDAAMISESSEGSASSDLAGTTVDFTWDESAEGYVATAGPDDSIEQEVLDRLDMRMDLSCLLPADGGAGLEVGDRWEVELADFFRIGLPGGNLALTPDQEMPDVEGFDPEAISDMLAEYQERALELLEEWVDGSVDATFTGMRSVEGRELAVVELEVDLTIDADLATMLQSVLAIMLEQFELPVSVDVSFDLAHVAGETGGDGELLWDIEGRHGKALHLAVDYEMAMDIEISMDMEGESHSFAAEVEFSGVAALDIAVE